MGHEAANMAEVVSSISKSASAEGGALPAPTVRELPLAKESIPSAHSLGYIVQAHPSGDATRSQILMAGPVTGLLQSAFRAELQALRYALFWKQKIRIWSDCQ